ncbi:MULTISPECIES: hypothetical protein [Shinella]|uniref:hypothetical protein n=1 Tax=Shinella TaxID=323620 RepID=UPI0007DA5EF1|nr:MULTISPECIES: hypothetical protein [Shinella]ANH08383.1 hypothetical protein shn_30080 [Shinella sp. HZN7]
MIEPETRRFLLLPRVEACSSIVDAVEAVTGKPTAASNPALAWDAFRKAGHNSPLPRAGRLWAA